jgi:hypothetical protein
MVDIDGVISLFGFDRAARPHGRFHSIDGIPHFLSSQAAEHLLDLWGVFEPVWASGWEEKANEYLPHLLQLPGPLPYLSFDRSPGRANAHWKLDAIEAYAGSRALAWVDDAFNDACHAWAAGRGAPTLLVQTSPSRGLTPHEKGVLLDWARNLQSRVTPSRRGRPAGDRPGDAQRPVAPGDRERPAPGESWRSATRPPDAAPRAPRDRQGPR